MTWSPASTTDSLSLSLSLWKNEKTYFYFYSANVRFPSWVTDSALSCAPWDVSSDIKSDNKNLTGGIFDFLVFNQTVGISWFNQRKEEIMDGQKRQQAKLTRTHSSLLHSSPTIWSSIHSFSSITEGDAITPHHHHHHQQEDNDDEEEKLLKTKTKTK